MKKKIIGLVLIFCAIFSLVLVGIRIGSRSTGSSGDQVLGGETESEEHAMEAGNSNLLAENGGTEDASGSSEATQEEFAGEAKKTEDGDGSNTGSGAGTGDSTDSGNSGSTNPGSGTGTGSSGSSTGTGSSGSGDGTGSSTDSGNSGSVNPGSSTGTDGSGSSTGNNGAGSSTDNGNSGSANPGSSTGTDGSGSGTGTGSSGSSTGTGDSGSGDGTGDSTDSGNGSEAGGSTGEDTSASYRVAFAMGNGQSASVTLPETKAYPADTAISALPIPGGAGSIFLGWYYDAELTDGVEAGDAVKKDMTLYAKVAAGEAVTSLETPDSVVRSEVAAGSYTFTVSGVEDIASALRFVNLTGGNIDVPYSVEGNTVTAKLEAGQTYQAELTDDHARFLLAGEAEAQPESVRYLNLLTAKAETKNATLNTGVKQLPYTETSGLDNGVFAGLYQIDDEGISTANTTSGTFTYSGELSLQAGDTVAITSGDVDLTDITSTEGEVAYIKILSVNGTTYTYEMAEVGDVLFIPDVLPIEGGWDLNLTDGYVLTISVENLAVAMENAEADSLDVGDFLGFLAGAYDENITTGAASYGKITGCSFEDGNCVITYEPVEEEAVEGALDVYYTQEREIELTEEEKAQIETKIRSDVAESGYAEEAALYLAAVMLESDNLSEAPDMERVSNRMRNMEASPLQGGNGITARAGGNSVQVSFDTANIRVGIRANSRLEHLNGNGFDVDVRIPFEVTISGSGGNAVVIRVTAAFEEEVILKQNISTKRHRIRAFKYDYSLNASFEVGNYTGISFRADIATEDEGNEALSERLQEIMNRMEAYQNGTVSNDGTMDSLAEIYRNVMEKANDSWIDILNVRLFETNGSAFLHIFCWQVKGSFVVSANLSASVGMEFDYTMQKRYIFSVRVKSKTATNETIDLIEPNYNFNFYVVGTVGIRAGLRLEMYVGLISLKLDKIGITAEVGAYARLYGYFFYHLGWTQNGGRQSSSAGAMLTELGIYLEIKFVAQAFNSSRLTWNPTLYSHEWPLWSAGEEKNVYAFFRTDDTEYAMTTVKTLALPGSTYDMKYMALKSGETGIVSRDDNGESSFIISFTDPAFSYDPATNTVTVTPETGSVAEETEMLITWKNAALAFTSKPIQKIIRITWSDPDGVRYISFDTMGGSGIEQLSAGSGAAVTWPAAPVREGYSFAGWYTDRACTTPYTGSVERMPEFPEGTTGMTLYAKWTPAEVSYTVEHYLQELNGTYVLSDTEEKTGITGGLTAAEAYAAYVGFTAKEITQETIAADGSTVISVYYDRDSYTVTFDKNDGSEKLTQTYRYEASLAAPLAAREGYTFLGWFTESTDGEEMAEEEWVTENTTWYAHWIGKENTVCFDTAGGSAAAAQTVQTGNKILKPADPTREGYTFRGWYQDAAGTKEWDFATDTVGAAMTLYAKWAADGYTLSLDAGKGSLPGSAEKTVTFDAAYGALPVPTRQGYDFAGWYTAETDGERITEETTVKTAAAHTLYAHWTAGEVTYSVSHLQQNIEDDAYTEVTADRETKQGTTLTQTAAEAKAYTGFTAKPVTQETIAADGTTEVKIYYDRNTYTVTFKDGVSEENDIVRSYRYGAKAEAQTAQRTGYTLAGWCKDAAGTQEWDFDTDTVSTATSLYARWTADGYTVRLDARGGTISGSSEKAVTFDATYGALPVPDRDGYAFLGWYTAETDGERITEESTVKTAAAHTLYAHWKSGSVSYSVSHWKQNLEDEGYTEVVADRERLLGNTDEQTIAQARTYTGFTAKQITQETIAADGTTEVKLYYDRNSYQISWDAGEGNALTGSYTQGEVRYGTPIVQPDTPTKTATAEYSYSFSGWTPAVGEAVTETVSYTAQFTPTANRYAITYQGVENAVNGNAGTYTYGEGLTLTAPEKTGYTFLGWYSGETKVTEITKTQTGEVSLTAMWQINQYTIHFETDGGSAVADITQDYDTAVTAPADPEKTGHTFSGWSPELPSVMLAESLTITAQWTANRYAVTFATNGGSEVSAQSVAYGDTAVEPTAPERSGYDFTRWYTDADCTTEYEFTRTVTGPITLYAGWEPATYPITYEMNDGTNATENPASYTYGTGVASFADPDRSGYIFLGWYSGETRITEISGTQTGAVTLTAEWVADNRTYNIWVAGTQVTAKNMKDVLSSDSVNRGKVSYDPKAATLTLSGVKLTSGVKSSGSIDACVFISTPTTIRLVGENTIDMSGNTAVTMLNLYAEAGTLTFTGSGSLEMIAGATSNLSACLYPAYEGELVFDGCTVKLRNEQNGSGSYYGIYDGEHTDWTLKNGASLQISCPNEPTGTGSKTRAYMNRYYGTACVQLGNGCTLTLSGAMRIGDLRITPAAAATLTVSENVDGSGATQKTLTAGTADGSFVGDENTLKYATITVPAAAE